MQNGPVFWVVKSNSLENHSVSQQASAARAPGVPKMVTEAAWQKKFPKRAAPKCLRYPLTQAPKPHAAWRSRPGGEPRAPGC